MGYVPITLSNIKFVTYLAQKFNSCCQLGTHTAAEAVSKGAVVTVMVSTAVGFCSDVCTERGRRER